MAAEYANLSQLYKYKIGFLRLLQLCQLYSKWFITIYKKFDIRQENYIFSCKTSYSLLIKI